MKNPTNVSYGHGDEQDRSSDGHISTRKTVKGTAEGKQSSALEMKIPFICAFLDYATKYGRQFALTEIITGLSNIVNKILYHTSAMNTLNWNSYSVGKKTGHVEGNSKILIRNFTVTETWLR